MPTPNASDHPLYRATAVASGFGWFQTLLADLEEQLRDERFLRISTYLTQKLSEDQIYNVAINSAGEEFDAITSLRSQMQFGRPDFQQIFTSIRSAIESGLYLPGTETSLKTHVGVFFCGPPPLAKELAVHCKQAQSSLVDFPFYKEHF